jgi:hypothetical protein
MTTVRSRKVSSSSRRVEPPAALADVGSSAIRELPDKHTIESVLHQACLGRH